MTNAFPDLSHLTERALEVAAAMPGDELLAAVRDELHARRMVRARAAARIAARTYRPAPDGFRCGRSTAKE
jgi:hypothetical protein